MKDFTLVASFATEFEAKLVEMKLAEVGIPVLFQPSGANPSLVIRDGIKVYVNPEDFERASPIVSEVVSDLNAEGGTEEG